MPAPTRSVAARIRRTRKALPYSFVRLSERERRVFGHLIEVLPTGYDQFHDYLLRAEAEGDTKRARQHRRILITGLDTIITKGVVGPSDKATAVERLIPLLSRYDTITVDPGARTALSAVRERAGMLPLTGSIGWVLDGRSLLGTLEAIRIEARTETMDQAAQAAHSLAQGALLN